MLTGEGAGGQLHGVNPAGVGDLAVYADRLPLPNTVAMHYLAGL